MAKRIKTFASADSIAVSPIFRERDFVFDAKLVFVIMPFGEPWSDRIWETVKGIVTEMDLLPERADNRHGPIITEDIWRGIVEARIVVADVTGWNPNVFYELGIAHTLGKDVVLITQPTNRLPFDTQGYRHIIYSDNPAGVKTLKAEIPAKIKHYIDTAGRKAKKRTDTRPEKADSKSMKLAWNAVTSGWDPPLPSMRIQDARSQAGALKNRMLQYVYFLSEPEAQQFVSEARAIWPDDLDHEEAIDKSHKVIAEMTELLNAWRIKYAQRITR
jgi:hypothetical protein